MECLRGLFSRVFTLLIFSSIITACGGGGGGGGGGGSDTPSVQAGPSIGVLFDARLANVSYESPSYSGVTDNSGHFDYKPGESIVFSLGNYQFDAVPADEFISVIDLLQAERIDQEVINLARLLQSIDTNSNNDVITIPDLGGLDLSGLDLSNQGDVFVTSAAIQVLLAQFGNQVDPMQMVTEQIAVDHLLASAASLGVQLPPIAQSLDHDGDLLLNSSDSDDDNDGISDEEDAFPFAGGEDNDGDGLGNAADADDDNDGIADINDVFPLDPNESTDADGDGVGDVADSDDDNDGASDDSDSAPFDPNKWGISSPLITATRPNAAVPNKPLHLSGFNLAGSQVFLDNVELTPSVNRTHDISVLLPMLEPGSYTLDVTNSDGRAEHTITIPQPFRFPQGGDLVIDRPLVGGSQTSCFNSNDGSVHCWGNVKYWDLKQNCRNCDSTSPVKLINGLDGIDDNSRAVEIAIGLNHHCARLVNGGVKCWGHNSSGGLGISSNDTGYHEIPVIVGASSLIDGSEAIAKSIAVGYAGSCAIMSDDSLQCWGSNLYGGLGINNPNIAYDDIFLPQMVLGFDGSTPSNRVVEVGMGLWHGCALASNGAVKCWGSNNQGELGSGAPLGFPAIAPVAVIGLDGSDDSSSAVALAVGSSHNCVLLRDGVVKCWGWNLTGELGDGSESLSSTPTKVINLPDDQDIPIVEITAGTGYSCVRYSDNSIYCWGANYDGQLGDGTFYDRNKPVEVTVLAGITDASSIKSFSTGRATSCVELDTNEVRCWGGAARAYDLALFSTAPVTLRDTGSGSTLDKVVNYAADANNSTHCLIIEGGALRCWGSSDNLDKNLVQMGDLDGSTSSRSVVDVKRGGTHSCALLETGAVQCWGLGAKGQLGFGRIHSSEPADVLFIGGSGAETEAQQLALGPDHSCGLMKSGAVKCWGNNREGQLGNGSGVEDSGLPVTVTGIDGSNDAATAVAITANTRTCALMKNGTVNCWGDGDVTPVSAFGLDGLTPASTAIDIDITGIDCVLRQNKQVDCLGPDNYSFVINDAVGITSSYSGACALLVNGGVQCWGDNNFGQLGAGIDAASRVDSPVDVIGLDGASTSSRASKVVAVSGGACAVLEDGGLMCWGRIPQATDVYALPVVSP